ncbi:hypothetical protein Pelo_17229 [Pelomyxa schiedti]|nr:hypothetical protein Pelo_17229 [Pelomyxa schiedti]
MQKHLNSTSLLGPKFYGILKWIGAPNAVPPSLLAVRPLESLILRFAIRSELRRVAPRTKKLGSGKIHLSVTTPTSMEALLKNHLELTACAINHGDSSLILMPLDYVPIFLPVQPTATGLTSAQHMRVNITLKFTLFYRSPFYWSSNTTVFVNRLGDPFLEKQIFVKGLYYYRYMTPMNPICQRELVHLPRVLPVSWAVVMHQSKRHSAFFKHPSSIFFLQFCELWQGPSCMPLFSTKDTLLFEQTKSGTHAKRLLNDLQSLVEAPLRTTCLPIARDLCCMMLPYMVKKITEIQWETLLRLVRHSLHVPSSPDGLAPPSPFLEHPVLKI